MLERLKEIEERALSQLFSAKTKDDILRIKGRFIGRKGELTAYLRGLKDIPLEDRRKIGREANLLKERIEERIKVALRNLHEEEKERLLKEEPLIDITLPGRVLPPGRLHPITQIIDEIVDIFLGLGFNIAGGPEVEEDYYNFEALNIPKEHPARDMQDTFYIKAPGDTKQGDEELLLRTHTSPVQIRVMENKRPPLRVIAPGTAYRRDSDLTHTPMFHQVEGFMVDRRVTFSNLKGVLTTFLHEFFGHKTPVRFRPSFFPFTEPSAEVDIGCLICDGKGCRVCKGSGWLEVLGAGMINPAVFKVVGYDPEEVTGFAFGMGIERMAMLKFGITDIRMFFENDVRFLRQF